MKNDLVSIIIPCFNYGHYILDALNSVNNQTFANWECIIINDGSTDNSKEIIEKFIANDGRFKLININNTGVSNARNIGIKHSTGMYIFPLDADNIMHKDCLTKCVAVFANPIIRLVYCEVQLFGGENRLWNLPPFDYITMLKYNMIDNSCLILREDFNRVGGYRLNMINGLEDWDFLIAILEPYSKEQVFKFKEPLYYYRVNKNSRRSILENTNNFNLMQDNIIYNNYAIYQKYYPKIFERIQKFDYYNVMMNNSYIKIITRMFNKIHQWKQRLKLFFK